MSKTYITNPSQFAPPPPRRIEPAGDIPGLLAHDGSFAQVFTRKLTAFEFGEYQAGLRDENGQLTLKTWKHNEMKYISKVICDRAGNPLWQTEKEAVDFLGPYDQETVSALFVAAVKANAAGEAAVESAEKNSERIPDESMNGISASPSDAPILVS